MYLDNICDAVFTNLPYYGNIGHANFSAFFLDSLIQAVILQSAENSVTAIRINGRGRDASPAAPFKRNWQ